MTATTAGIEIGTRERHIAEMAGSALDVLIVGGGINGAGIARDLAMRAGGKWRIGLVERRGFSGGTSGRNSQLIHGGLRYLKYFEFSLVKEALHERATLVKIAPHLVEPLPLLLPFYRAIDRYFYGMGLWLYDQLAGRLNIGRRRYLAPAEVAAVEPGLAREGLHSAAIYHDCAVGSARLVLENLQDAVRRGAFIANYVQAEPWRREGGEYAVDIEDSFNRERRTLRARRIVDARGPWETGGNVRLVRGSHLIVPRLNASDNAIAYFGPDGRIIFVIPWGREKKLSLVGTTDIDHGGSADDVRISAGEVAYLRGVVRRLFPGKPDQPVAAYSSLRPLIVSGNSSATAASRSHKIWMEDGVLKIAGGKYTTYRSMAAEAVDLLAPEWRGRCRTGEERLPDPAAAIAAAGGPVAYAVRHEMARRLPDVMYVSTYWGHEKTWTAAALEPVAREMGAMLGWDAARVADEVALTLDLARMPGA
ncbi:MAG: glycerol-3-phosphate dehydrogenase/oxidase [Bryobacteraceae bacterium]